MSKPYASMDDLIERLTDEDKLNHPGLVALLKRHDSEMDALCERHERELAAMLTADDAEASND
jgi:hypothetical protein